MEKNGEITNKNDVIVRASNFVVEHAKSDTFAKHYVLDEQIIGEGAYGRVQKCHRKGTLEARAVKIIEKRWMNDQERVRLQYEVNILKNLNHPNIVRLYEVFEDKSLIWLVTELCDGRELFEEI